MARAFAQNPAVLGRWLELRQVHAHLPTEIKAIEVARRWQEARIKNVRRRFTRFRHSQTA